MMLGLREKKYRVPLIQQRKYLYKCWNYYSVDEITHTILYLK